MKITTNTGRGYVALTRDLAAAAMIGYGKFLMTAITAPADAHHGGGGGGRVLAAVLDPALAEPHHHRWICPYH